MLIAWIACGWSSGFWSALSGTRISMWMQCTLDCHLDCPRLTFWFSPISCFKRRDTVAALQMTWGQFASRNVLKSLITKGWSTCLWQRSEPVSHVSSESSSLTTQHNYSTTRSHRAAPLSWFSTLRRGRFRSAAPPQTASERTSRRTFTREGLPFTSSTTRGGAGSFKSQNKHVPVTTYDMVRFHGNIPSWLFLHHCSTQRPWSETDPPVHNPPRNRGYSSRSPRAFCMEKYLESFQISPSTAPATKSDTWTWTSPSTAPATKVTLELDQVLRLPRKMTLMIDHHHIWNVIGNA